MPKPIAILLTIAMLGLAVGACSGEQALSMVKRLRPLKRSR
jgi:hypothetical protein